MKNWHIAPRPIANLWLGKFGVVAAWLGLALALVSPPHGFVGIELCWMHGATGIPCLGCGLTRSLSCALRGMFVQSWHYHPMGLPILALFLFTAIQSILPKSSRNRLAMHLQARETSFRLLYFAFVSVFVAYGAGRALLHCIGN